MSQFSKPGVRERDQRMDDAPAGLAATAGILETLGDPRALSFLDLAGHLSDCTFRLAVFGEFSTGKSTLINALLGRRILPSKARPTTGHVTSIVGGASDELVATFSDGRVERCGLDAIDRFAVLDLRSRAREGVARLEVRVAGTALSRGLTILDTPGLSDADEQTARARRAVAGADLVLFVLNANQMLGMAERRLAVGWMARELGKPVVPVLNFMNQVDAPDRDEIRKNLNAWARANLQAELGRPYFEVDALTALRSVLKTPGAAAPTDDFAALRAALEALTVPTASPAKQVRQRARAGHLRVVVAEAAQANYRFLAALRRDRDALRARRQAERRELTAARKRIEKATDRERAHVLVQADTHLAAGFDSLTKRYAGSTHPILHASAQGWLDSTFAESVGRCENTADAALVNLARGTVKHLEPMTVTQLLTLEERTPVVFEAYDNSTAVGWGAVIGGIIGAAMGGPGGAVVGGMIGGALSNNATAREPDYAASYIRAATADWDTLAAQARDALAAQFDSRVADLLADLDARIRSLERIPEAGREQTLRASLARHLKTLAS